MYANAEQALEGLRHKRTKQILPTKIVANNTRLIYYADELVGLRLHDTVIALYREDGVTIDLRGPGSPNGEGWFTKTTLDRIDSFTPVRTVRERGLTKIIANPVYDGGNWWAGARLYTHGCSRSSNGSFTNGLDPAIERHIARLHSNWDRKADNFAKRCVTYWRRGGSMLDCCQGDGDSNSHLVGHIEANEPCVPWAIANHFNGLKSMGLIGDPMAAELVKELRSEFRWLSAVAVKTVEPNFPYPQPSRI